MTRRALLAAIAFTGATSTAPLRSRLGIATTSYSTGRKFVDTLEFLEHCGGIGAAGIQSSLTSLDSGYLARLDRRAKDLGMWIEVMTALPEQNMSAFIANVQAAKQIGAVAIRSACLSGRRYETFNSFEEWKGFVARSKAAIARAVPVVEKFKLPLGIENHKDWTTTEMLALLKSYSSEYVGACLDTGNNIALLNDPTEVVEQLAPFAVSTHIKDMGVQEYADGFLLSEVPIGDGILDIKKLATTIQRARRQTKLSLEMMTRDPLKVPCLTETYWATFPGREALPLARTLRMVRENRSKLTYVTGLNRRDQLRLEEKNVQKCLAAFG